MNVYYQNLGLQNRLCAFSLEGEDVQYMTSMVTLLHSSSFLKLNPLHIKVQPDLFPSVWRSHIAIGQIYYNWLDNDTRSLHWVNTQGSRVLAKLPKQIKIKTSLVLTMFDHQPINETIILNPIDERLTVIYSDHHSL